MATQISNEGASLSITVNGSSALLSKLHIREISVVGHNTLKIDVGRGPLQNIYIPFADITVPAAGSAVEIRDILNGYLSASINGGATEAKQQEILNEMALMKQSLIEIKNAIAAAGGGGGLTIPLLIDETVPGEAYKGFAVSGTDPSQPDWAIQKTTYDKGVTHVYWADGNMNFDNIWDDRYNLTYL